MMNFEVACYAFTASFGDSSVTFVSSTLAKTFREKQRTGMGNKNATMRVSVHGKYIASLL